MERFSVTNTFNKDILLRVSIEMTFLSLAPGGAA